MTMSEDLTLTLYLVATAAVAVMFARNLLRSRDPKLQAITPDKPLPGGIFQFLTELPIAEIDRKKFEKSMLIMQSHLMQISKDPAEYVRTHYGGSVEYGTQETNILTNIAVCLRSFLKYLKKEPVPTRLDYSRYKRGIAGLIAVINEYWRGLNEADFIRQLVVHKKEVYFSLLGNPRHDHELTEAFVKDFCDGANRMDPSTSPESVVQYLTELETKWTTKIERLRAIDDSLILPLTTVRNLLQYCSDKLGRRATITRIKEKVVSGRYDEIVYMGLTFDNSSVVQEIFDEAISILAPLAPDLSPAT